ncbi:MAG: TIGR01777 family protein [Deltaproteobacteria bacterium]|nr:MAG: TIGR01777 family protein [Deltaproteobacteria bacterium]
MLGTWLGHALRDRGDEVFVVTRSEAEEEHELSWTSSRGIIDLRRLEGADAVVNLMGAPIADRPWTRMRRNTLRDSRIQSTATILQSLSRLDAPPKHYVGVGHLGIYGERGEQILDESDDPGEGFLAELALDWEQAHLAAERQLQARTAVLRMAVALSPTGGVFPLMIQPFRVGLGGWLGDGRQYLPWISVRDAVSAFLFLLDHPELEGLFNGCVPVPTRQKEWARALGRALNKPVVSNAPKWALRGALGDLADELYLASIRAVPQRLQKAGFSFQDAEAEATFGWLVACLDDPPPELSRYRVQRRRRGRIRRS